jgi:hypothetical protein
MSVAKSHRPHDATLAVFLMRDSLRTAVTVAFTIAAISSPMRSATAEHGGTVATVIPANGAADDIHHRFDGMA